MSESLGNQPKAEQPWWKIRSLVLTLIVTAWMLSIAKYNDELGPIFISAPVKQVSVFVHIERVISVSG